MAFGRSCLFRIGGCILFCDLLFVVCDQDLELKNKIMTVQVSFRSTQSDVFMGVVDKFYNAMSESERNDLMLREREKAIFIKKMVCEFGGFEETDEHFIDGRRNGNNIKKYSRYVDCKHTGVWFCMKHTKLKYKDIARIFTRKDRTICYHVRDKMNDMIWIKDEFIMNLIQFVEKALRDAKYIT